jgi:2-polyprenyl-6-methoxyphenol hydroxylase-like FAD-dependent oxidoreductase
LESIAAADLSSEIIIVGAGMAGTVLAVVLGRQGRRVMLVDPNSTCPPLFKAEKTERDQVAMLRKLGLLECLLPYAGQGREVWGSYNGHVFKTSPVEQYGLRYADMVNAVRAQVPAAVIYRVGRVKTIANGEQMQRVQLEDGEELTSRLVVLACGLSAELQAKLGIRRRIWQKDQSLGLGFDIAGESEPFPFGGLTYYSMSRSTRIDYLTLFKFRDRMRANLFVFRAASDPWVREFIQEPEAVLRRDLPKLNRVIGEYCVTSKVEAGWVDLYRVDSDPLPGIVIVGDSYQTACPATGFGLDKVLTDVDVLSECVPSWLATSGMGADKLAGFYHHPRKLALDTQALKRSREHRRLTVDASPRWRIHRFLLHFKWQLLAFGRTLKERRNEPARSASVAQHSK